jgi:hypothetical protein
MEDSFEITANNFTGSTKVQANHHIPNIMANGVEEHSYLEFNRRMYGVLQQLVVPKELAKMKKGAFLILSIFKQVVSFFHTLLSRYSLLILSDSSIGP